MAHAESSVLVWEVLSDFPCAAILQRVGLLESMIDVIGAAVADGTCHVDCDGLSELTPLSAMSWFASLLEKCHLAMIQLADGKFLCESLGPTGDDESSSARSGSSASLATQMVYIISQ